MESWKISQFLPDEPTQRREWQVGYKDYFTAITIPLKQQVCHWENQHTATLTTPQMKCLAKLGQILDIELLTWRARHMPR